MGNCNACCGNDKGDQIDIKSPNEDMKNTLTLAKKNVRLIVKIQAWARGNQVRRRIANKMNTANNTETKSTSILKRLPITHYPIRIDEAYDGRRVSLWRAAPHGGRPRRRRRRRPPRAPRPVCGRR